MSNDGGSYLTIVVLSANVLKIHHCYVSAFALKYSVLEHNFF